MAQTIGNPLSWVFQRVEKTSEHIADASETLGGDTATALPQIRTLSMDDIREALRLGRMDFLDSRADAIFSILIYPVVGLVLMGLGLNMNLIPLLFPLVAGFAIVGPVAAVGLYEISRRREMGERPSWYHAFSVVNAPSFMAIVVLGLYLAVLFIFWMMAANAVYALTLGPEAPASLGGFVSDVLTTGAGWAMIVLGGAVGILFALVALAISVVSFPLLLDRNVGVPVAVVTSVRVLRANPRVVLSWGAIVGAALVIGSIPLLLGLIVVMPVLGHATWHLYRRAIV